MKHFLLFYDYVPDYLEIRTAHRAAHFAHARPAVARGELFLAGACTDAGPPVGVLVFSVHDRRTVEDFARADPYVVHGVVTAWRVREWTTVVGRDALTTVPSQRGRQVISVTTAGPAQIATAVVLAIPVGLDRYMPVPEAAVREFANNPALTDRSFCDTSFLSRHPGQGSRHGGTARLWRRTTTLQ